MKVFLPYSDTLTSKWLQYHFNDVSFTLDLKDTDLLVLVGGTDVNSNLYGHEPGPYNDPPDAGRDYMELIALRSFKGPVLGICRGFQLMHVAKGGKLNQHVTHHLHGHDIIAKSLKGYKEIFHAPANHHQLVVDPSGEVLATSPEGDVEAVQWGNWLGVQFHPEWSKSFSDSNSVWVADRLGSILSHSKAL